MKHSTTKEFGVLAPFLSTNLKNKEKILDEFEQSSSSKRKRVRSSKFLDMEAALLRYVASKCKSSELSHDQHNNDEKSGRTRFVNGYTDFSCTNG